MSGVAPARERLALVLLFVLALLVRLPGLDGDLWIDEIGSLVGFFRPPLDEIVVRFVSANNHVLYSVLAHGMIVAFGEAEWALRLPACLFGAATAPALVWLARRWLPAREAWGAGLILAVAYHHAYFSQSARGYTGMVLLAIVTTGLLARGLERGRTRDWAGYAVLTAANVYLLLSGLFVCVGQTLGALLVRVAPARGAERARRARQLLVWVAVAAALTLLAYAPLLRSMITFFTTADRDVGTPPSLELLAVLARDAVPHPLVAILALAAAPIAVVGAVDLVRRAPLLAFGLALPPVLELGVAVAMGVGTYPRRFLLVMPFVLLVAVRGAGWAAGRLARGDPRAERAWFGAAVALGLVAAAAGLPRLYRLPKQDYRGALAWVQARRAPGDVVAATWVADTGARHYDPSVVSAREPEQVEALLAKDRPLWLIGTFVGDMTRRAPRLADLVASRFELVARFPSLVGDGDIVVWRPRDG